MKIVSVIQASRQCSIYQISLLSQDNINFFSALAERQSPTSPSPITTESANPRICEGSAPEAIPPIITANQLMTPSVPPQTADFKYYPLRVWRSTCVLLASIVSGFNCSPTKLSCYTEERPLRFGTLFYDFEIFFQIINFQLEIEYYSYQRYNR